MVGNGIFVVFDNISAICRVRETFMVIKSLNIRKEYNFFKKFNIFCKKKLGRMVQKKLFVIDMGWQ